MNATEIIDEIKHLPPVEQAQVLNFVRSLDEGRLTGAELGELADRLAQEADLTKAQLLKEQIVSGFYGKGHSA